MELALETYYVEAYRIRALWGAPRASESDAAVTAWIMVLEESLEPLGARIGPHSVVIRAWRDFTERALSSAASPKFDSPTRDHLAPPRARYPERRPASWIVPRAPRSLKKRHKWCCRGRRRALASFGAESATVWRADRVAHVRPTQGEAADATDPPQGPRFRRCVAGSPRRDGIRASSTAQVAPAVRCGTPSRCAHRAPCQRIARATRARRARATARLSRSRAEHVKRSCYPLALRRAHVRLRRMLPPLALAGGHVLDAAHRLGPLLGRAPELLRADLTSSSDSRSSSIPIARFDPSFLPRTFY